MLSQKQAADQLENFVKRLQVKETSDSKTPADAQASPDVSTNKEKTTSLKEVEIPRLSKIARDNKSPYRVRPRQES